jgi:rhodanese-related sulfurtransferase
MSPSCTRLREVAGSHLPDVAAARAAYLGDGGGQPVTRDQLRHLARTGAVTVLDVRPREEYAARAHPRGGQHPLDELADRLDDLPGDGQEIAYCRGCLLRARPRPGAATGRARPHRRQAAGGMLEWRLAGLPVTVS